ncbi:MAG: hypothetical protein ACRCSV_03845 [Chlamydiales bacterium]
MSEINQAYLSIQLQETLDNQVQNSVLVHNQRTAKLAELATRSQEIVLQILGGRCIEAEYKKLLQDANQAVPSFSTTPISWENSSSQEVNEKVQNQMDYFQLLCNNEQAKEVNLLDLSVKNYHSVSNILLETLKIDSDSKKSIIHNSVVK